MNNAELLERIIDRLKTEHNFSDSSIQFLKDKGLQQGEKPRDKDWTRLLQAMSIDDESFADRRKNKNWLETMLDRGDSEEITTGRYERYVEPFKDISSEQALVQGRMKFAVEYIIELSDLLSKEAPGNELIDRSFTAEEKEKLRSIYTNFRTKDYIFAKIVEKRTNHDIVAANTVVTVRAQQLGLDDALMRKLFHIFRTSSDVNTNVTGELYTKAIGQWTKSLAELISTLETKALEYQKITCVARTHGQDAQLTTLGHIYANLAEQIKLHLKPLIKKNQLLLDGKIGGAIGTDVDALASFPDINFKPMYKKIVEKVFGLNYVEMGNDQDCSNASLCTALDTMVNVGFIIKKAATDTWLYCSRQLLSKKTQKGESGSSVMPQKANPFFAEGCEALMSVVSGMVNPIKEMMVAYREQGDLRRSITKREGFHPIMLSIIGIQRLIGEINKYQPDIVGIESEIYRTRTKIAGSAINGYLRTQGVPDAYDRIKDLMMKPHVRPEEVETYIDSMNLQPVAAKKVKNMLYSILDTGNLVEKFNKSSPEDYVNVLGQFEKANHNTRKRKDLLGNAVAYTRRIVQGIQQVKERLLRYAA